MENTEIPNTKYDELKKYLKGVLKTAKKLGLQLQPNGGYTMGYDINHLPDFPVGLFGALSIIEGPGARCKLGLTYDETQALEAGFNGSVPSVNKRNKKGYKVDQELVMIGSELSRLSYRRQQYPRNKDSWNMVDENGYTFTTKFSKQFNNVQFPSSPSEILLGGSEMAKKEKGIVFGEALDQIVNGTNTVTWKNIADINNEPLQKVLNKLAGTKNISDEEMDSVKKTLNNWEMGAVVKSQLLEKNKFALNDPTAIENNPVEKMKIDYKVSWKNGAPTVTEEWGPSSLWTTKKLSDEPKVLGESMMPVIDDDPWEF